MTQQINLYNPLFLKQEKHFSAATMLQALGIIVLGMLALYVYGWIEVRDTERVASQYVQQVAQQREQFVNLGTRLSPMARSKALEADLVRLDSEIKARRATLDALSTGELGNVAGFSEFLAAFGRQALSGVWLTGIVIGDSGNELVVHGRVLRPELMPAYLRALSNEAIMRGRRVVEMKLAAKVAPAAAGTTKPAQGPDRYVEFTVTAPLRLAEVPAGPGARTP